MNYRKLLEKYMRDVVAAEGTAFVDDYGGWVGSDYTKKELAVLLAMRDQIYKDERLLS